MAKVNRADERSHALDGVPINFLTPTELEQREYVEKITVAAQHTALQGLWTPELQRMLDRDQAGR